MRGFAAQLVRHLPAAADARTDGDLLAGFLNGSAEDDFAELVCRHGPMVWGACCRTLPDPYDAEDAFQAVFLVLVRRGRRLTTQPTLGPWLHRVAVWTARNVRRRNARRLAKRVPLSEQLPAPASDPDLPLDLDAALLSLPEKFRSPIVLCHLLGFSRADAAERLGCPEGTLSSWLSRGLAKLRAKLGGLDPAKALGVAAVAVPSGLASSAVRAAVAARVAVATVAAVSSTVSQVVEGVIRMFWVKKATAASVALFAVFAFGVGVGLTARQGGSATGQEKAAGPGPVASADPNAADDLAKQIADLEKQLRAAEALYAAAMKGVQLATAKVELLKSKAADPKQILDDMAFVARFQDSADRAAAEVKLLKDKLDSLKAAKQKADEKKPKVEPPKAPPDIEELKKKVMEFDKKLNDLNVEEAQLRKEYADLTDKADNIARQKVKIQQAMDELRKKREELGKQPAATASAAGYMELTVHGKQGWFEYSIKETDANGKEVGSVIIREPEMLLRVLTRTKNDPTAPKELRLIVDPSRALTGYPTIALKACDASGFQTIRFTGYIPQGNFLAELPHDQKGEAKGYKRYDNTEVTAASLIKQIEDWRRTW
jgi:RNA polymerase sigma factor (sigma-70 family)